MVAYIMCQKYANGSRFVMVCIGLVEVFFAFYLGLVHLSNGAMKQFWKFIWIK